MTSDIIANALRLFLLAAVLAVPVSLVAQTTSKPMAMVGGGDVSMRLDGDVLHVAVNGPRTGLASLCIGDDSRVRILHASAAVGEAVYEKSGQGWARKSNFEWKLRDSRTAPLTNADTERVLNELGWVANPSAAGSPARAFTLRLTERSLFVGVTFLTTNDPIAMSYWPESMNDGCREMKVGQGYLPDTTDFRPSTWHRVR